MQAFSRIWGGVKVEGFTDGIAVCDSPWCYIYITAGFHRGITYQGEQVFCSLNKCESSVDEPHERGPGRI